MLYFLGETTILVIRKLLILKMSSAARRRNMKICPEIDRLDSRDARGTSPKRELSSAKLAAGFAYRSDSIPSAWRVCFGAFLAVLVMLPGWDAWGQAATANEGLTRTQEIGLKKGWNAIYLEVQPDDSDPGEIFRDLPIDKVATYFGSKDSVQFVTDPSIDLFENLGWAMWYSEARPDAFLTSLSAIYGRRAYLVHAKTDVQWQVKGTPLPDETEWRVDQLNLVGFPIVSPGAPSFAEFFAGAKGPRTDRIYRMVNGSWQKLGSPASTPMRSGEAFWIFCDAPTSYEGPLTVETKLRRGLILPDGAGDSLVFRNVSENPLEITVEHLTPLEPPVPLSIDVKVVGAPSTPVQTGAIPQPAGAWSETFVLRAGGSVALPFRARTAEMTRSFQASLLRITTDLGTESWVPVYATRSDLQENE
ncbi:MAG: hypothetical protein ACI9NC_001397 [Verrucomicrobiales bacterium]|jgi:hypothetical protein